MEIVLWSIGSGPTYLPHQAVEVVKDVMFPLIRGLGGVITIPLPLVCHIVGEATRTFPLLGGLRSVIEEACPFPLLIILGVETCLGGAEVDEAGSFL